jgi:hypothetical protein
MAFAERVIGELAERLATPAGGAASLIVDGSLSADQVALADRDVLLAAALGACECWGEEPACPSCSGDGGVGWVPPDPALYDEYVKPAVLRASSVAEQETTGVPAEAITDQGGVT